MCLLRLLDVVELLFTLVAFITKGKHDMELVRLTALAKALGLVHPEKEKKSIKGRFFFSSSYSNIYLPVAKDGRGWNPQILSPTGKPFF